MLFCLFLDGVQVTYGVDTVKRPANQCESRQIDFGAVHLK